MEIKTSKMMEKGTLKPLKITKGEYKKILNALNYSKYDDLTINNVLNNITEYTAFVNNLAKLRNVNIYNMSNADALDKIYRDHIKKRQDNIKNLLLELKLPNIGKRENIPINDAKKIMDLKKLRINDLGEKARMRYIKNAELLSKEDLIYTLLKSEKSLYEGKYLTNKNDKNELNYFIVNFELYKLSRYISKKQRQKLRK